MFHFHFSSKEYFIFVSSYNTKVSIKSTCFRSKISYRKVNLTFFISYENDQSSRLELQVQNNIWLHKVGFRKISSKKWFSPYARPDFHDLTDEIHGMDMSVSWYYYLITNCRWWWRSECEGENGGSSQLHLNIRQVLIH